MFDEEKFMSVCNSIINSLKKDLENIPFAELKDEVIMHGQALFCLRKQILCNIQNHYFTMNQGLHLLIKINDLEKIVFGNKNLESTSKNI